METFLLSEQEGHERQRAQLLTRASVAEKQVLELQYVDKYLGRNQPAVAPLHPSQTEAPAVDEWFRHAEEIWNAAHTRLQRAVRRHKEQADIHRSKVPVFSPGDRVWHSTRNLPLRLPCRKLSLRFVGPFKALRRVNEVTYHLQLPADYRINPTFHVSLLRPVVPGPLAEAGPSDAGAGFLRWTSWTLR
ncbi:unnamed protein product [Coregonus sp. 'balchen']|nr:unnamed protein product [Coregonus sp. 'balchen']